LTCYSPGSLECWHHEVLVGAYLAMLQVFGLVGGEHPRLPEEQARGMHHDAEQEQHQDCNHALPPAAAE